MARETLESLLQIPVHYDSFLLRTWRTAAGGEQRWMIEDVITGERNTFTALPELVIFLRNYAHVGARARHRRLQP